MVHPKSQLSEKNRLNLAEKLANCWLPITLTLWGLLNLIPFLAPVAMHVGWTAVGNTIYDVYGLFCHQMAQRSYFLFGQQLMYTPEQLPIELSGLMGTDSLALRAFRGSDTLGWKVAWSDRMVTMYGGVWIGGILYYWLSRKRKIYPPSIWLVILFTLPMALDGGTHLLSDFAGLTAGFRYTNDWLANLTNHAFAQSFYIGDTIGSFNSWMRIFTGLLFGLGCAAFAFPHIEQAVISNKKQQNSISRGKVILR